MNTDTLNQVLTIPEIARRWNKHPVSIRRAIDSRHKPLEARKSPDTEQGIWLITLDSVIRRWGNPAA